MSEDISPGRASGVIQSLIDAFGGSVVQTDDGWVEFAAGELYVIANVVDIVDRVRIRVYLPLDDENVVKDWVDRQPAPRSGLLQAAYIDEDVWRPRLLFERPVPDHDWSADPLFDEVDYYLAAWLDDTRVEYTSGSRQTYIVPADPRSAPPASAWLLKGDDASFPTTDELSADQAAADVGIFTWDWTTAAQTQFGDLVLFCV